MRDSIPIADPQVGERELARVESVFESGQLAHGPEVEAFEEEFAAVCGVDRAVATANGTAALHAVMEAFDIGAGDHVLTSPFSFVASANAVRLVGATPVFADIDPATYNLDPAAVEARCRETDVDAILAVHLYGLPAPMDRLREIADDHDAALIEDAAQAHGAALDGRPVGSLGDAACFSFYPTKNMTTGEGGVVTTDRADVAERLSRFVNHGRTDSYRHAEVGHNFRLSSVGAAIGRVQLERLPEFNATRRENARRLDERLADAPVRTPIEPDGSRHVYHQYTIRHPDRDRLVDALGEAGVGAAVYYPRTIPDQPAYEGYDPAVPAARSAAEEVLSLPVHPTVTERECDRIADAVAEATRAIEAEA